MKPRIAFHSPLKPPDHPTPSGDREFARLLMKALRLGGFDVSLVSKLRTLEAQGDPRRQATIEARAERSLIAIQTRLERAPVDLWVTYHLYYKAPDFLGPAMAARFGIPYVVIEGSHAPSRLDGPWARWAGNAEAALRGADLVLIPNPKDRPGLSMLRSQGLLDLPPFLDVRDLERDTGGRRAEWARRLSLDPEKPWLLATGMFRRGDKTRSYVTLAAVWARVRDRGAQLIIVGDGAARDDVQVLFGGDPDVRFTGSLDRGVLAELTGAADLFVWPAIGEAFGLAPLEAQALGVPAVLGDRPGIRAMVRENETALLTPEGDAGRFAEAVATLLDDPARRRRMGVAARAHVLARHDFFQASKFLKESLLPLLKRGGRE